MDKQTYYLNPKNCLHCKSEIPYDKRANKFCGSSCSATYNNTGKIKVPRIQCQQCGKLTTRHSPSTGRIRKFCSQKCSSEYRKVFKTDEELKIHVRNRVREVSANYRARLRNQTPDGVDRKAIREYYSKCPRGYEVDHIVPISKGGLHILENLQYLPMSENRRKGNR